MNTTIAIIHCNSAASLQNDKLILYLKIICLFLANFYIQMFSYLTVNCHCHNSSCCQELSLSNARYMYKFAKCYYERLALSFIFSSLKKTIVRPFPSSLLNYFSHSLLCTCFTKDLICRYRHLVRQTTKFLRPWVWFLFFIFQGIDTCINHLFFYRFISQSTIVG